jgi:putative transposase
MPQDRDNPIRRALTSVLSPNRIRTVARKTGAVRRRRKVDIASLVYSIVLGFGAGNERSLAGLRRTYERATGVQLVASAFYDRFSVGMARLLRRLAEEALAKLAAAVPKLARTFKSFRQVLVTDGTLLRLHDALEPAFPSVWTNYMRASAKLHVVMNVVGRGAQTIKITHGSRHDLNLLHVGPWVKRRLLIFDLGYFQGFLFSNIDRHGGFFLSRLRERTNPIIVRAGYPEHAPWVGLPLQQVVEQLQHHPIDFDVRLHYMTKRAKWHHHTMPLRVVGIWNHGTGRYHLYITNIPRARLSPEQLSAVYAARWEVELLFREIKTHYRINQIPSRKLTVTECLIYASLLTLAFSRKLRAMLAERSDLPRERHTLDRWAVIFSTVAHTVLDLLVGPERYRGFIERRLDRLLRHEAPDPNRRRLPLPDRAQRGVLATA